MDIKIQFSGDLGKALKEYPDKLVKNLHRGSKRSASLVEDYAKLNHRYTDRTGRLTKSILGTAKPLEVVLTLLDDGQPLGTKYGKYVHSGQGSWGSDKFIEKSIERNEKKIFANWQRAIDETNKDF